MDYFMAALRKYAVFSGRAQRAEYWYFVLFNILIGVVVSIVSSVVGDTKGYLSILFVLVLFIPSLSVTARRLHDTGRSGWMLLLQLIPVIGFIWILILMCLDSKPGDNKYGPNPKLIVSPATAQPSATSSVSSATTTSSAALVSSTTPTSSTPPTPPTPPVSS